MIFRYSNLTIYQTIASIAFHDPFIIYEESIPGSLQFSFLAASITAAQFTYRLI